jgi:hypothetical protein
MTEFELRKLFTDNCDEEPLAGGWPNLYRYGQAVANAVIASIGYCTCTMAQKLNGDGCSVCNPTLKREIDAYNQGHQDALEAAATQNAKLVDAIKDAIECLETPGYGKAYVIGILAAALKGGNDCIDKPSMLLTPNPTVQDRRVESAHRLAMLALQSKRYSDDHEYRDAVDAVLSWSLPAWPNAHEITGAKRPS